MHGSQLRDGLVNSARRGLHNNHGSKCGVIREKQLNFSFSNRQFEEAKENGKIICCKYYEIDGVVNFFAKQTVLKQHFRTIHRSTDVKDLTDINAKCKVLFQDSHGEETTKVIQKLSRLRLQTVNSSFYICDELKI